MMQKTDSKISTQKNSSLVGVGTAETLPTQWHVQATGERYKCAATTSVRLLKVHNSTAGGASLTTNALRGRARARALDAAP